MRKNKGVVRGTSKDGNKSSIPAVPTGDDLIRFRSAMPIIGGLSMYKVYLLSATMMPSAHFDYLQLAQSLLMYVAKRRVQTKDALPYLVCDARADLLRAWAECDQC